VALIFSSSSFEEALLISLSAEERSFFISLSISFNMIASS